MGQAKGELRLTSPEKSLTVELEMETGYVHPFTQVEPMSFLAVKGTIESEAAL